MGERKKPPQKRERNSQQRPPRRTTTTSTKNSLVSNPPKFRLQQYHYDCEEGLADLRTEQTNFQVLGLARGDIDDLLLQNFLRKELRQAA